MNLIDEEEAELWQSTVAHLLSRRATPEEAIEGAHLILEARRRSRQTTKHQMAANPSEDPEEIQTGIRFKNQAPESAAIPPSTKRCGG